MTKDLLRVQHELRKARARVSVLENEEIKLMGVYAVQCTACHAGINQSCKKVSGIRTRPHQERIHAAVAVLAAVRGDFLKLPKLPSCDVCAIGAAMIASTIRLDRVPIMPLIPGSDQIGEMQTGAHFVTGSGHGGTLSGNMSKRALSVFPESLLHVMEMAFEEQEYEYDLDETACLRAIYKNLIKNKGKKFTTRRTDETIWP